MAAQAAREKDPRMFEAVLSAFAAFVKAGNFAGKRQYLLELDGLQQLADWSREEVKDANGALDRKIKLKIHQLIYDCVLNDDSLLYDGYYVRDSLAANLPFIESLLAAIITSKIKFVWNAQSREYILNILRRVHHRMRTKADP